MGRDYNNNERYERRGFGGPDDWSADMEEGVDPYAGDRPTRRSGWEGGPVTSYRQAGPRETRGRRRPVNWDRERDDERRQPSHGYDLDHDVYRAGDRAEWRGEFGPKEDRAQWERDRERAWRGAMRGAIREGRDWLASGRDRYRSLRESGGDPYRQQRYGQAGIDRSGGQRFGELDDVRTRYGRDYRQDVDWTRDTEDDRLTGYPSRGTDRDRGSASRAGAGQYTGRGPRGYQRSDERIREDVSDILWEHDEIDAGEIDVTVENGEVTLEGTVDSRWTKRMAEDAAHDARGVHDVHNRLRVRREQPDGWDRSSGTDGQRSATGTVMMEGGRTTTGPAFAVDMTIVGADGDEVGIVKEVRDDTLLVDRPIARDIYIPRSAVQVTDGSTVRLSINSGDVDNQGWKNPPMTGTDTDYDESVQMT